MSDTSRTWDAEEDNRDLRVRFINGDLTEDALGRLLERNERTRVVKRDVGTVLETFVMAAADILQCFCHGDTDTDTTAFLLLSLRDHIDAVLANVSRLHGRSGPRLTPQWRWNLPHTRSS